MSYNEKYMKRAIELAKKGEGWANPNPMVGAVIVKNDRIIGEGYHTRYGELHAERHAFANLTEDAEGAQMYVTLEPCCHYGKQPPCVEAIVEHKIKKVYVGSDDPNKLVSGKGYEYLREHNVEVETHVMKKECDALNQVFFHYITTKTPYVVMKYAMTMDGKIATYAGLSKWITGTKSREQVQTLRHKYMGIMVGIGTVLADDPMLTCRMPEGKNPIRIVCDSKLRIPIQCNLVQTAKEIPTIVAAVKIPEGDQAYNTYIEKINVLKEYGVQVIETNPRDGRVDLKQLMLELGERKIDSILLEGGGTLNYNALEANIVNEAKVYIAPKIFGGRDAITPVEGNGIMSPEESFEFGLEKVENIENDILLTYIRKEAKDVHRNS